MKTLLFTLVAVWFGSTIIQAQELAKHQWKDRILLLIADSFESEALKNQKKLLSEFSKEIKERKLIQYAVSPSYYNRNTDSNKTELGASTLFKKYNTTNEPFKIVLIGLDGEVKLEKDTPVQPSVIFNLIDQMPMRKNELRNE